MTYHTQGTQRYLILLILYYSLVFFPISSATPCHVCMTMILNLNTTSFIFSHCTWQCLRINTRPLQELVSVWVFFFFPYCRSVISSIKITRTHNSFVVLIEGRALFSNIILLHKTHYFTHSHWEKDFLFSKPCVCRNEAFLSHRWDRCTAGPT